MTPPTTCGCTAEKTRMLEIGTRDPIYTVKHCPLHRNAGVLQSALEELMESEGGEPRKDDTKSAMVWMRAQVAVIASMGTLRCCGCDKWCGPDNPPYDYAKDQDFADACTEHFNLVHMTSYSEEYFDKDGGAVLCTACINLVLEVCRYCGTGSISGDDCGKCKLSDEQAVRYVRRLGR